MADINSVVLAGRLTREAELRYANNGTPIVKIGLALNTRKKQGEEWVDEANFFDITVFGRQGEALHPYLTKGKQIAVRGELRQDRWEQEGQSRSRVYVLADNIMLLGGASGGEGGGARFSNNGAGYEGRSGSAGRQAPAAASSQPTQPAASGSEEYEDDIPF